MSLSPTIRDVARLAGVSVATASRVLSKSDYPVAAKVRKRVLEAARDLNFTPNAFARGLSKQESRLIGMVIPNIREPFFLQIVRGIEDITSRDGYMVILCNTDRDLSKEQRYIEELRAMRAGVILVGRSGYSNELLEELLNHPAPVVAIGRHELDCSSVRFDNVRGGFDVTSHVIQLGHRRIAYIGGPASSTSAIDRLEGFRKAMEHHGISVDERLLVESDFTLEGGISATDRLLKQDANPPEAIVAANDYLALGAIYCAKARGLRVPYDLSVTGFNDIPIAAFIDPPLTTLRLPLYQAGEIAADLLLRQLKSGQREHNIVELRGELVVRGSTIVR